MKREMQKHTAGLMAAATKATVHEAQRSLPPVQLPRSKAGGQVSERQGAASRLEKSIEEVSLDSGASSVMEMTGRKTEHAGGKERRTALNLNGLRLGIDFGTLKVSTDARRPTV